MRPEFHPAPPLEDEHTAEPTHTLERRVTRYLERKGHLPRESNAGDESSFEPRLGRRSDVRAQFVPGSLCCDHEGSSLHAKILVPAGQRDRLERLCRFVVRPAIATERFHSRPTVA